MAQQDDDLRIFEAQGAAPLPPADDEGHVEHDGARIEFIRLEHAEYLARSIPGAEFLLLPGVSHFAPLQRPELFNDAMLNFLGRVS